jgi:hypothetical protein
MDGTVLLGLAGIGSTLIVGLVGAVAVLIVARWQRQDAQRHRLADTKRLAYTDYLALLDELEAAMKDLLTDPDARPTLFTGDWSLRYRRASSQVTLVATGEVRAALVPLLLSFAALVDSVRSGSGPVESGAAEEALIKGRAAFTNAARKDLGIFEKADVRAGE